MNPKVDEILQRIRELEAELETELESRREALHVRFEHHRVQFEEEILQRQRQFKIGVIEYIRRADLRNRVTAPVIYSMIVPLVLLDISVTIYQLLCFPLYRIERVRRQDYMAFDRRHLAYLNAIEKFHCTYCSYGNGLASYVREIIARTEQYWCPIRHARRLLQTHSHYSQFVDYGDAEAFRKESEKLRMALQKQTSTRGNKQP
jgi:hypothetical protein